MNLRTAHANLQQQRDLDERHAQDDALQTYYKKIRELITDHGLLEKTGPVDEIRLLARAQTITLLERLDPKSDRAMRSKREMIRILYDTA